MALGSFLDGEVKRTSRNLAILNICILALVLFCVYAQSDFLASYFDGPIKLTEQSLASITAPNKEQWVEIEGSKFYQTGLQNISRSSKHGDTITHDYVALDLPTRLLLAKVKHGNVSSIVSGTLNYIPQDIYAKTITAAVSKNPSLKGVFLPLMLTQEDFSDSALIGILIGSAFALLALWNLKKAFERIRNPYIHPTVKKLVWQGADFANALESLQTEANGNLERVQKWKLGKEWLMASELLHFYLVRISDLTWVYRKVTKKSTNFIPTGKDYAVVLWNEQGDSYEITMKEVQTEKFIEQLSSRCPGVVLGYSDELLKLWNSNRGDFILGVRAKKKEAINAGGSPA